MKLYSQDTTNFSNNGLGFLTDTLSCLITDEINGLYQLKMTYPIGGKLADDLIEENIIKCKVADGTEQLFRIVIVEKDLKKITITAQHIFYDLLNNFLEDVYPQNLDPQSYINYLISHANFNSSFTAYSDLVGSKSGRYVRKNPVEAIMGDLDNSVLNIFGGELKRDNFQINLLTRVGNDNGVKILFGKNIKGIDITIDITNMATRIMPQGFDGLLLPEKYIDSPLINNYPTPKVAKIDFEDVRYDPTGEEGYADIQDAYTALRAKVQQQFDLGIDKPQVNIKVDWVELSKTNEYKNYVNLERVNLGDTITANILGVDYQTRVISTTYNALKDIIEQFEIGTFQPAITKTISKLMNDVDTIIPTSILEEAQLKATELITQAMGGYVYKTESELYIMDTNNPSTATKVWRWNLNGLGYSSNGINGPYTTAMTMNGAIVADFITTGVLRGIELSGDTIKGSVFKGSNDGVKLIIANDSSGYLSTNNCLELNYESDNSNIIGFYGKFWNDSTLKMVYIKSSANGYYFLGSKGITTDKITAGNIDCGTCTLNSSSEQYVSFNKTFSSAPKVVITPYTSSSGVIAPKIRAISQYGFKAIIGGSGFSGIDCNWIAIS